MTELKRFKCNVEGQDIEVMEASELNAAYTAIFIYNATAHQPINVVVDGKTFVFDVLLTRQYKLRKS